MIGRHLVDLGHAYARVGLEAGPLSLWLYAGLVEAGLPAIAAVGLAARPACSRHCTNST